MQVIKGHIFGFGFGIFPSIGVKIEKTFFLIDPGLYPPPHLSGPATKEGVFAVSRSCILVTYGQFLESLIFRETLTYASVSEAL